MQISTNNMLKFFTFILICSETSFAFGLTSEEFDAQEAGLKKWNEIAASAPTMPRENAIKKLSEGILKTSKGAIYSIEGTGEVREKLKEAMLSIPGHAKYFQDKIDSLRTEVLANEKIPDEVARLQQEGKQPVHIEDYNDFRKIAFPVLGLLPSSEAVAVLGHFLNDPEGRDGKNLLGDQWRTSESVPFPPNCAAAWIAISNLGIENPPIRGKKPDRDTYFFDLNEVDAWKDWWNEVKEGRRTYRFIGSSVEYGPDGPASKELIQRVERDRKRDDERAAGHRKSSSARESGNAMAQVSKPSSIAWLVAIIGLCGAAAWYFLRGRKTA